MIMTFLLRCICNPPCSSFLPIPPLLSPPPPSSSSPQPPLVVSGLCARTPDVYTPNVSCSLLSTSRRMSRPNGTTIRFCIYIQLFAIVCRARACHARFCRIGRNDEPWYEPRCVDGAKREKRGCMSTFIFLLFFFGSMHVSAGCARAA